MNTKQLVAAISLLSAIGIASAQQNQASPNMGYFDASPVSQTTANESGKTRAQVLTELKDAQEHGLVDHNGFIGGQPFEVQSNTPGKTRAQVRAELKLAQEQGIVGNLGFADSPIVSKPAATVPEQTNSH